jgi:hypothetical protein
MPAAANLLEAALFAPQNLEARWVNNTLQARMVAFAAAANPIFPDDVANNHPLGNWVGVIAALAPSIEVFDNNPPFVSNGIGTIGPFRAAVDYVYRMFKFASRQLADGLITSAQGTALLAAYNAQFP